jgi:hypothetical protein
MDDVKDGNVTVGGVAVVAVIFDVVVAAVVVVVAHFESSRYISTGSRPCALNSTNLTSSVGTGETRSVTGKPMALGGGSRW